MTQQAKKKAEAVEQIVQGDPIQVIYADRILNIGFGPAVSRLTLGMEVASNTFSPFSTLVIPTHSLIDALLVMQKALQENDELNAGLMQGLDAIRDQLSKMKK